MPAPRRYPEPPPAETPPVARFAGWRSAIRRLGTLLPDFRDVHVYGGGALMAYGAGLIYRPAAWLVAGLALAYLGIRRR